MTDVVTHKPMKVSMETSTGPYLRILVSQLEEVEALLKEHRINYWVDEDGISIDGAPMVTWISFGRGGDADKIQAVLDGVR